MTASGNLAEGEGGNTRQQRRLLAATLVGTTIEWYDFNIYAMAAGVVFSSLFFGPLLAENPALAMIISLSTVGVSFLFRPLGAIVAGHLGDRVGRKRMLVLTLTLMGVATTLIGFLPTYSQIGIWAPILLVVLRILQGFSAGGEWGGAALMSVEHAPKHKRGLFGAYPQIGVPAGVILATAVWLATSYGLTTEQYMAWGWRVPFLVSALLIFVGFLVRRTVDESPVFQAMSKRKRVNAPLKTVFTQNARQVLLSALIFLGNGAAGYVLIAFLVGYAIRPPEQFGLGMDRTSVLIASLAGYVGWLVSALYGGWISDKLGRVKTIAIGYSIMFLWAIPMFLLVQTASVPLYGLAVFVLSIGLGLSYGPMSAMFAEMFPPEVRYSGAAIGNALGAIAGGAFAPMIAQILLDTTGWPGSVGMYIMAVSAVSLIATIVVPETSGKDLYASDETQAELPHGVSKLA